MTGVSALPDRAAFLTAPREVVAAVAPPTVVYALGGTRRRAVLDGIPLDETYIDTGRPQMVENIALFFNYNIQHLIIPCLGPRALAEVGEYGAKIIAWTIRGLVGPEMIADYQRRGWRARFIVPAPQPELQAAAELLRQATPVGSPTVWFYLVVDDADPWRDLLAAIRRSGALTLAEAQQAVYGEVIPPARLFVGFGKLVTGTTLVPPLLTAADLHCYWYQRAGMQLDDRMLRTILYDFAYARRNWNPERGRRYADAPRYASRWETTSVIGVGSQVDNFWFPDPFPAGRTTAAEDPE